VGHADDMRCHAAAGGIVPQGIYERLVDFQAIHRQSLQVGQAAVPRAEIIDQYLMTHRSQGLQVIAGHHYVNQTPLSDLERDLARRDPVQRQ